MSDLAAGADDAEESLRPLTALLLGGVGLVAFVLMLLAASFGPTDEGRKEGGPTAVSRSATGFAGLVELAEATGRHVAVVRSAEQLATEDLVVLTPPHGAVSLDEALSRRAARPTLLVLPKWDTVADRKHPGWERRSGLLPRFDPGGVLAPATRLFIRRERGAGRVLVPTGDLPPSIRFATPRPLQVITGFDHDRGAHLSPFVRPGSTGEDALTPLVTDGGNGVVLARLGDGPFFILSDPDLLSNLGTGDARNAAAALALLDWMNSTGADGIKFDVTLDGLGGARSLVRLALVPPFLPLTLTLALAALLAVARGLGRFGPPARRPRAIAFGKRALLDNTAALFRMTGREGRLGSRYVQAQRERAQIDFAVPARLRDAELDAYLDGLGPGARFTALAERLTRASGRDELVAAARALHHWHEEVKA